MLSLVQTWITVLGIFPVFEISRHASVEPNRKVSEQYREYIKRALAISYMLQLYVNIYYIFCFIFQICTASEWHLGHKTLYM